MAVRTDRRRRVGLACSDFVRRRYIDSADLERLQPFADFFYEPFSAGSELMHQAPRDPAAEATLATFAAELDVLVVCHGAPFVSGDVLAQAPALTLVGELEGDRFGYRIDVAAAHERGVLVVDTSHGSSLPSAEWALGLALIGRRNAGALFRRILAHEPTYLPAAERSGPGYEAAELAHKRVGMIGFGHIGRRLAELLRPFDVEIVVSDPTSRAILPSPSESPSGRSNGFSIRTWSLSSCPRPRRLSGCSVELSSICCGRAA